LNWFNSKNFKTYAADCAETIHEKENYNNKTLGEKIFSDLGTSGCQCLTHCQQM